MRPRTSVNHTEFMRGIEGAGTVNAFEPIGLGDHPQERAEENDRVAISVHHGSSDLR